MEWDTAAGDAVVRRAGGNVVDLAGRPLRYGKPGFENPHFIAWGRRSATISSPAVGSSQATDQ
jgi:3'(2'), 5'-bisphosphate nucleotidase